MENYEEYLELSAQAVADAPRKMDITVQLFIQTPVWIQKRKELTAIDKDVYGIIYTFIKTSMLHPTQRSGVNIAGPLSDVLPMMQARAKVLWPRH